MQGSALKPLWPSVSPGAFSGIRTWSTAAPREGRRPCGCLSSGKGWFQEPFERGEVKGWPLSSQAGSCHWGQIQEWWWMPQVEGLRRSLGPLLTHAGEDTSREPFSVSGWRAGSVFLSPLRRCWQRWHAVGCWKLNSLTTDMGYTVDTTRGEGSFAERSHIYISVGVGFGVLVFDHPPHPPKNAACLRFKVG